MPRKRILCFASYYLPGFKWGGPLRSLMHMQEWLGDEYEFAVVTRNRDLGETACYEGLADGTWHAVGGVGVWYLAPPYWRPAAIRAAVESFRPDALYFHSSVDPALTIVPLVLRRLGLLGTSLPVLVAPRGEFSPGARAIKPRRKAAYFAFARLAGLYRGVIWHATKDEEAAQVRSLWGNDANVVVAPNLPSRVSAVGPVRRPTKESGSLRLVFLSRIARMKNLHGALEILQNVRVPVTMDIYGTHEDPAYWAGCQKLMARLPGNVTVTYRGTVAPHDVIPTLSAYDALFLPTLGENFGHVIHEALLAGCPVIISDQTPWRGLAAEHAGFDIPLDRPDLSSQAIERLAAMDSREHESWSDRARAHGERYSRDTALAQRTRAMLATATTA
ncbi:MAG: glycosyltransferase [Gammaproteobacteria bacterium]|nr:glycosyltransferase [Gammaproteobacteria bacterium]